VEVAHLVETVGIRDSKDPEGRYLAISPARFANLIKQIKNTTA
jgi:hypothetical protein